jgi:hypothetical protein
MHYKLLTRLALISAIGMGTTAIAEAGMFDWMNPNKWINNNRDYDRDYYYRGYGYGYPNYGYAYPGLGGYGYPYGYSYPGMVYPGVGYPAYTYPIVQPQQNTPSTTQAAPPTPQ